MKIRFILIFVILFFTSCASTATPEEIQKATAHYQMGLSYYNGDKPQMAYIEFQKALELNPYDKKVLNAIGIIHLLNFEDIQTAVGYFGKAIQIDPNFAEAYNNMGVEYEKAGMLDEA